MRRVAALILLAAIAGCGADGAPQPLVEEDERATIGVDGAL